MLFVVCKCGCWMFVLLGFVCVVLMIVLYFIYYVIKLKGGLINYGMLIEL